MPDDSIVEIKVALTAIARDLEHTSHRARNIEQKLDAFVLLRDLEPIGLGSSRGIVRRQLLGRRLAPAAVHRAWPPRACTEVNCRFTRSRSCAVGLFRWLQDDPAAQPAGFDALVSRRDAVERLHAGDAGYELVRVGER